MASDLRQRIARRDRRKQVHAVAKEWDEYGQAFNDNGLILCVCGEVRLNGNWDGHDCPYDDNEEEDEDMTDMTSIERLEREGLNSRGGTSRLYAKTKADNRREFKTSVAAQLRIALELGRGVDITGGIMETPERVTKMWLDELTSGYDVDIESLFRVFDDEGNGGMVIMRDIPVRSVCEHHLVPIVGYAHVGYFPNGKVIGLSKLARIVDAFSRRFQIQERLTKNILDAIDEHLDTHGTMVVISAEHLCMTLRGVQAPGTRTLTSAVSGRFLDNKGGQRDEFLKLINGAKY